jgi:hypothetical protein
MMLVDPPSGWRYGFPRPYDATKDGDLGAFLVKNGYPSEDIDFALRYCRFIGTKEDLERVDVV